MTEAVRRTPRVEHSVGVPARPTRPKGIVGRPVSRAYGEEDLFKVMVAIKKKDHERLQQLVAQLGTTQSTYIRNLIVADLDQRDEPAPRSRLST